MSPHQQTNQKDSQGRETKRIEAYTKFWNKDDFANDSAANTANRVDQYSDVVNGYYDGATILYEYGWGRSFHFSRFYKGESCSASLARHEHYLAAKMQLKPGMRVLDVGCGVGGPAREIAHFANVNIIGLNNNEHQVRNARRYTKKAELDDKISYVTGDFIKMDFPDNYFDAVYSIEATCHAPTFEAVYGEILRVLKPGGVFGVYEWVMTDEWDPSIPAHKQLGNEIEFGNGIPEMRPVIKARQALKTVGFQIEHEEDLADCGDSVPWYYPLEGDLSQAQTFWDYFTVWRTSWSGQLVTHNGLKLLELLRIVPSGTHAVGESLRLAAVALVKGGQTKLFTPMFMWVARKPLA